MPHDLTLPTLTGQIPYDVEEAIDRLRNYGLELGGLQEIFQNQLDALMRRLASLEDTLALIERGEASLLVATLATLTDNAGLLGQYLGGSLQQGIFGTGSFDAFNAVHLQIDRAGLPNPLSVRATVRTFNVATSVTPRLQNITTGLSAGTGVATTSVTSVSQSFAVTLAPGVNEYRLQLTASNATHPVFGLGTLQFS